MGHFSMQGARVVKKRISSSDGSSKKKFFLFLFFVGFWFVRIVYRVSHIEKE